MYPRDFGAIYDAMQSGVAIKQFANHPMLIDAVAFLLQDTPNGLMSYFHALRMDVPHDTKNNYDWHSHIK